MTGRDKRVAFLVASLAFFLGAGVAVAARCPPEVVAYRGLVVALGGYAAARLVGFLLAHVVMEELIQWRLKEEHESADRPTPTD